jgi:hypothetical protein
LIKKKKTPTSVRQEGELSKALKITEKDKFKVIL